MKLQYLRSSCCRKLGTDAQHNTLSFMPIMKRVTTEKGQQNAYSVWLPIGQLLNAHYLKPMLLLLFMLTAWFQVAFGQATLSTDKTDYQPGQSVIITGTNWFPGETVSLLLEETPVIHESETFYAVADASGKIYNNEFIVQFHDIGQTFTLTATGLTSGYTAQVSFTDAAGNLDQGKNGGIGDPPVSPVTWENGNANQNDSHYEEGQSIPYRLFLGSVPVGTHTLIIGWDIKQSGKNALDYITSPQQGIAETVNPLSGFAGTFSGPNLFAIPVPIPTAAGIGGPQPQTSFNSLPAASKNMWVYNATITNMTYVNNNDGNLGDLTASQSETRLSITFTVSGSAKDVVFSWGGHIASRLSWGSGTSASAVNGSPYHTRFIEFDGTGGNQDRSLSAAAVVFIPSCDISGPDPVCPSSTNTYTATTNALQPQYTWSATNATINGSNTGASVSVTGPASGSFTVTVQIADLSGGEPDVDKTSCSKTVTVGALPTVTLPGVGPFCVNAAAVQLAGTPAGGTYSGTGVSPSGLFTPATAGVGSHVITYSYTNATGCTNTATTTIVVNGLPTVGLPGVGPFCIDAAAIQLQGTPSGGTYSGTGVSASGLFTPATAGVGSHVITYNYTNQSNCSGSANITIVVNPLPEVTLPGAGPYCIDAAAVQLQGSPAGGTYSGTGVSASGLFTPATAGAGSHVITYSFTDENGCDASANITIVVNPLPEVTLPGAGPYCIDAAAVQLQGTPSGGTYSGTGVSASGLFTPATAGAGSHVITYSFTDENGCDASANITIVVNPLPEVTLPGAGPYCIDAAAVQLQGSPAGGTYSGTGVSASGLFTPATAGAGSHVITYSFTDENGCDASANITIVVNPLPEVTLPGAGPYCIDAAAVQLQGSPAGGTYSGTGVSSSGLFTPATAGAGSHVITYSFTDENGCDASANITIVVNPLPEVTLPGAGPYCIDAAAVQLQGSPAGGTYSGTGVSASGLFTPATAGAGSHVITYSFTDENGCDASANITIVVNPLPEVTLPGAGPYCIDAAAVQLQGSPAGGTYSGTGVSSSGLFTPATAGAGSHVITYSFTDENGCSASANITIVVNLLPEVTLPGVGPFCIDAAAVQLQGSPAGGTYSGTGVSASGLFTPATAGVGSHVITYSFDDENGCSASANITIVVNPLPEVTLPGAGPYCIDAAAVQLQGSPAGGTYSGTGVSASGLFTPATAGVGSHVITYSFTDENGCDASANITIVVNPLPQVTLPGVGPFCSNEPAVQLAGTPAGGTYSGTGVSASGLFTPATAGAGSHVITYSFDDENGCSASASITIVVNPTPVLLLSDPPPICSSQTLDLTDASLRVGSTLFGGTLSFWMDADATVPIPDETSVGTGTYYIKVLTAAGCSDIKAITITLNPQPVLVINNPAPVCAPATINLTDPAITAGSNLEGGSLSYWNDSGASSSVSNPGAVGTGTYYIKVETAAGCSDIKPVTVTVNPTPPCSLNIPSPLPTGGTTNNALCVTSQAGVSYFWTVSGPGWQLTGGQGSNCVIYTAGDPGTTGTFTLLITNTTTRCASTCTVSFTAAAEGCTPGFWKNATKYWDKATLPVPLCVSGALGSPYDGDGTTKALFRETFGVTSAQMTAVGLNQNLTLIQAINLGGGGFQKLARHAAAGILSACALTKYPYSTAQILQMTHDAIVNKTAEPTATLIAAANETGNCTLSSSTKNPTVLSSIEEIPDDLGMTTPGDQVFVAPIKHDQLISLNVYPNPYINEVNFRVVPPVSGIATLEIFNLATARYVLVYKGRLDADQEHLIRYNGDMVMSRSAFVYKLTIGKEVITGTILPAQ